MQENGPQRIVSDQLLNSGALSHNLSGGSAFISQNLDPLGSEKYPLEVSDAEPSNSSRTRGPPWTRKENSPSRASIKHGTVAQKASLYESAASQDNPQSTQAVQHGPPRNLERPPPHVDLVQELKAKLVGKPKISGNVANNMKGKDGQKVWSRASIIA
jgi:hypothetical protein